MIPLFLLCKTYLIPLCSTKLTSGILTEEGQDKPIGARDIQTLKSRDIWCCLRVGSWFFCFHLDNRVHINFMKHFKNVDFVKCISRTIILILSLTLFMFNIPWCPSFLCPYVTRYLTECTDSLDRAAL